MAQRWKLLVASGLGKKRGLSELRRQGVETLPPPLKSPSLGLCSLGSSVSNRVTDVQGGDGEWGPEGAWSLF